MGRRRPTIGELQDILDDPTCGPIELLPDGSITVNEVITDLRDQKDNAYRERNRCVAFIAQMALSLGWTVGRKRHPESDKDWDNDWRNILFIDSPAGQLSWHFHDSEWERLGLHNLPEYQGEWDGHTTEEKYKRMEHLYPEPSPAIRVAMAGGVRTIEQSFLDENAKPEPPLPWTHTVEFMGRVRGCRELPNGMWVIEGHDGGQFGGSVLLGRIKGPPR